MKASESLLAAQTLSTPVEISRDVPAPVDSAIAAMTLRIARGDEAAFRDFHLRYAGQLMAYALVVHAGDEHLARETWQATLVKAARRMKPFSTEGQLWGWLATIARRTALDAHRSSSRLGRLRDRFAAWLNPMNDKSSRADEPTEILRAALEQLTATDRALIEEKYFEGSSVWAMAADRQCSEKAVESALTRARQRLRAAFLEELRDE